MNLPLFVAKRYLFSKKSFNVINIITGISIVGVGIGTMALIAVLSVFNGLEIFMESLYNSFNPDISITLVEGKSFDPKEIDTEKIKEIDGVAYFSEVIEETVLLRYGKKQFLGTLKGVDDDFKHITDIESTLYEGEFALKNGEDEFAVIGQGIAYNLGIYLSDYNTPIQISVPKKKKVSSLNIMDAFTTKRATTIGLFEISIDIDLKYVIVSKRFAQDLLGNKDLITGIELGLEPGANVERIQSEIKAIVGNGFHIKDRYQQNDLFYKTQKTEKLMAFLIITFVLIIAIFNVVGSLTMLMVEKENDIAVFLSLGASTALVKKIFTFNGLLISFVGAASGLVLGFIIVFLQQYHGLLKLGDGTDFLLVWFLI